MNVYADSQLLFKAADFGLAVCQLERQTLGGLLAVANLKCRGRVNLALLLPAQLRHPLGTEMRRDVARDGEQRGRGDSDREDETHANEFSLR